MSICANGCTSKQARILIEVDVTKSIYESVSVVMADGRLVQ